MTSQPNHKSPEKVFEERVEEAVLKHLRYRYREKALDRMGIVQKLMPYGYRFEDILAAIDRLVDQDRIYYILRENSYPGPGEVFWGLLRDYEPEPRHYTEEEDKDEYSYLRDD